MEICLLLVFSTLFTYSKFLKNSSNIFDKKKKNIKEIYVKVYKLYKKACYGTHCINYYYYFFFGDIN